MSLSVQTIAIVKSTAPIMKERGLEIISRFYPLLFSKYPQVKEYFNPANQLRGCEHDVDAALRREGSQTQALANAVYAYAANIDNLSVLGPAVEKIAQKHASLHILPEHYPAVGECLIQAVAEVLGPAVTPEVAKAWIEAYDFLAKIFIDRENAIRAESARRPGGWAGFREFQVADKVKENAHVSSFYLRPRDAAEIPDFKPGQFVSFRLKLPGGQRIYRNYSLSDRAGRDYFRVTIKKEPKLRDFDQGVSSNYFHDHVNVGDVLEVGPPLGDFFLQSTPSVDRPLVLISAGIGLTPLISMLNTIVEQNKSKEEQSANQKPEIFFVHSTKNSQQHSLKTYLREIATQYPRLRSHVVYTAPLPEDVAGTDYDSTQRVSVELLKKLLPSNQADFYFCGPVQFQNDMKRQLLEWSVPESSIHYEFFGPAS